MVVVRELVVVDVKLGDVVGLVVVLLDVVVRIVVVVLSVRDEVRVVVTPGAGLPKQFVPVHFRSKKLRTVSVWVWTL